MQSRKLLSLALLGAVVALAGCNTLKDGQKPNPQDETCTYLSRQMAFNARDNSIDARWRAPSQRKKLMDQYKEYGCG